MRALLYQLDAMSRKFVTGVLEQQGHRSIVGVEQQDALRSVAKVEVDVVFAGVQGDGLDFVRSIRAQERRGGAPRTHVIACAVGSTNDTRQKCTQAGADAFLPIPISTRDLAEALSPVSGREMTPSPAPSAPTHQRANGLDVEAALERVEGDRALLEELLRLFADECNTSLRQMRTVWNARDVGILMRLAHTLKGSAANVGANGVSEAARDLETQVRSGHIETATKQIANLEREVERLMPELDSFLKQAIP